MSAELLERQSSALEVSSPYNTRTAFMQPPITRQDPVVYGKEYGSKAQEVEFSLSRQQLARFEKNGFLILRQVFPAALLSQIQENVSTLFREASHLAVKGRIPPEEVILEPQGQSVRSVFNIHKRYAFFSLLCQNPVLADVARQILNDDLYIHQSRINYKPAFEGKDFPWHSDFETWHSEDGMPRMRAVSCSILLSENNEYNGPLLMMPGSHKTFVPCLGQTPENHYKQSLRKQAYGVPSNEALQGLAEAGGALRSFKGQPGDVIFFDCNLIHGSASNISPYARNNIFFVYNSFSNRLLSPLGQMAPRPEHIACRNEIAPF